MRGSRLPLIWEQTTNLGDWYLRLSFLTFLSVGKRWSPRGAIVRALLEFGSAEAWRAAPCWLLFSRPVFLELWNFHSAVHSMASQS